MDIIRKRKLHKYVFIIMTTWNFFKVISIVYGLAMVFRGPVVNQIPEQWQNSETVEYDSDKPLVWLWLLAAIGIFLMAFTWYKHFTLDIEHSWILGSILTLTIFKLSRRIYNYRCLRIVYYDEHIDDIRRTAILNVVIVLGGATLLYMGLFIY